MDRFYHFAELNVSPDDPPLFRNYGHERNEIVQYLKNYETINEYESYVPSMFMYDTKKFDPVFIRNRTHCYRLLIPKTNYNHLVNNCKYMLHRISFDWSMHRYPVILCEEIVIPAELYNLLSIFPWELNQDYWMNYPGSSVMVQQNSNIHQLYLHIPLPVRRIIRFCICGTQLVGIDQCLPYDNDVIINSYYLRIFEINNKCHIITETIVQPDDGPVAESDWIDESDPHAPVIVNEFVAVDSPGNISFIKQFRGPLLSRCYPLQLVDSKCCWFFPVIHHQLRRFHVTVHPSVIERNKQGQWRNSDKSWSLPKFIHTANADNMVCVRGHILMFFQETADIVLSSLSDNSSFVSTIKLPVCAEYEILVVEDRDMEELLVSGYCSRFYGSQLPVQMEQLICSYYSNEYVWIYCGNSTSCCGMVVNHSPLYSILHSNFLHKAFTIPVDDLFQ